MGHARLSADVSDPRWAPRDPTVSTRPATDRLADWVALVDARYPERDAASWDATGLQVGDPDDAVHGVLVCLDVTAASLDEAREHGCDLILAHHPLLFRGLARLTPDTAPGRLALSAARAGVAVLAAHSNIDVAAPGTTEPITGLLGLGDVEPLQPTPPPETCKLVTFVPVEDTMTVLGALSAAGAGVIGEYDHCGFRVAGTGSFRPSPAASPHLGERGELNEVTEERLEVDCDRGDLDAVVAALWQAHPYEEGAYDVYPLTAPAVTDGKGLGRVGELDEPLTVREVCDRLSDGLPAPFLRVAGELDAPVRRVAACGGAGDALIDAACAAGAECFVTGDLRHHPTLDARSQGLAVVDAGHGAVEQAAMATVADALAADADKAGLSAPVRRSALAGEPWADYRR